MVEATLASHAKIGSQHAMHTEDAFRDLRDSPQLLEFILNYLPALQKEAQHLAEIRAKRIAEDDTYGNLHKYQVFVRYNRYLGQINEDIIPHAIAFFDAIRGKTFDALGVMNGNGLMYLGLGPHSSMPVHQDYADGTYQYNRVVLPVDIAEPDRCDFLLARDGAELAHSFGRHPYGFTFNPAARHGATNESESVRTVVTFQFTNG